MRVLFIYPNINAQVGFNYGLAAISAVLKTAGHETRLLNINEKLYPLPNYEDVKKVVNEFGPELIGFSIVTPQYPYSRDLARKLRRDFDIPLICGGPHPTLAPDEVLEDGAFDYVCVGEGEYATLDLVNALASGDDTTTIRNLQVRQDGKVFFNPVRPFVDIEHLPQKDYDIFDFQHMIDAKNGWVGLMASRGCPFQCTYCCNHRIVKRYAKDTRKKGKALGYIRWHSVDSVLSEIQGLLDRYQNIRTFIFDDDLFTLNKEFVLDFCRCYARRFRIPFVVNAHVYAFDEDIAHALASAGCSIVKFGLESGSERVRREILKRFMSNEAIKRSFAIAEKAGLHTSAFVMIGLPHETIGEIYETIDLLAEIRPGRLRWSIFFPFPGTEAYDIAAAAGLIDRKKMEKLQNFMDASCLDFGPEQNLFIDKLQKVFPWYVNARSGLPGATVYAERLASIEMLNASQWESRKEKILEEDAEISSIMTERGLLHWAVKYNDFMAVRSDYTE